MFDTGRTCYWVLFTKSLPKLNTHKLYLNRVLVVLRHYLKETKVIETRLRPKCSHNIIVQPIKVIATKAPITRIEIEKKKPNFFS